MREARSRHQVRDLRGLIDLHIHTAPDARLRSLDDVAAVRLLGPEQGRRLGALELAGTGQEPLEARRSDTSALPEAKQPVFDAEGP